MRSRISRLTLLVLAGMLVTAGACGGDDDDDSNEESSDDDSTTTEAEESSSSGSDAGEEEYLAAIVQSMESSEDGGFGDTPTNECVAGVYVDIIGLENLRANVTPEELVEDPESQPEDFGLELDPAALWTGLKGCVDIESMMLQQYSGGDPAVTECMLTATTEEQRQALFVAYYDEEVAPDPAVLAPFDAAATQCGAQPPTG